MAMLAERLNDHEPGSYAARVREYLESPDGVIARAEAETEVMDLDQVKDMMEDDDIDWG